MKPKFILFVSAIFILACGLLKPSQPATQATASAPVQESTQIPVQPSPTTPSIDPNFFRDDFNGRLESGWQWHNEDPSNWSLTAFPNILQINADSGEVSTDSISNLLLRPAPSGNFQIETKLIFKPVANFQFAGLIIYENESNFIQVGHAFCDDPTVCAGDGLYIDCYQNGEFTTPNFATPYKEGKEIYLRLVREGDTYTLQTSSDGNTWILRGGQVSKMNPHQIGLIAGQSMSGTVPALFDYFQANSLP